MKIKLTADQLKAFNAITKAKERKVSICGDLCSGKTFAATVSAIECASHLGERVLMLVASYPILKHCIIPPFIQIIGIHDSEWRWSFAPPIHLAYYTNRGSIDFYDSKQILNTDAQIFGYDVIMFETQSMEIKEINSLLQRIDPGQNNVRIVMVGSDIKGPCHIQLHRDSLVKAGIIDTKYSDFLSVGSAASAPSDATKLDKGVAV